MSVVVGTNAGFIKTAPSADPEASGPGTYDGFLGFARHTSPSQIYRVNQIGIYVEAGTYATAAWQVAIYSNDAAPNPDEPNVVLSPGIYSGNSITANVGGWFTYTVNIPVTASTVYYIAYGITAVTGTILVGYTDGETGEGYGWHADATGYLEDPWGDLDGQYTTWSPAVYARYILGASLSGIGPRFSGAFTRKNSAFRRLTGVW